MRSSTLLFPLWKGMMACYLLLFEVCGASSSTVYLQIGDKCQDERGISFPNDGSFSVYESFLNDNTSLIEKNGSEATSTLKSVDEGVCDPTIPLECLSGRCQCKKGFTINRNATKCLEIARNGLDSPCEENIQCWKSLLGRMSECNLAIGKCQCYESESLPIVFHQGRCYYGETLGEFCQIEGLCEATIPNATCKSGGTCQCKEGHVPSWDKSRCLPIATDGLNSFCEENIQCEQSQMGALSECNQETMKCSCYKIPDMDTVFHGGKCYIEAGLGDVCQVSPQCQKKTENSVCSKNWKCVCDSDNGYIPNGNNTLCLAIPSSDGFISLENNLSVVWPGTSGIIIGGSSGGGSANNNNISNNNNTNGECQDDSHCIRKMGPYSRCNAKQKCECYISENHQLQLHFHAHPSEVINPDNVAVGLTLGTTTAPVLSKLSFFKLDGISEATEQLDLLDHTNPPSLVLVGNKCYLGKYLGQRCKFNKQCLTVTENSVCSGGRCVCAKETHVQSEDGRKCLRLGKGLNSSCDEDAQCTKSELGPLSRCNLEKKRCECANNVMPVVYFKGKCHFHRQLGSSCESNVECQAGSNYLAECSMGRCRCQNGTVRLSQHICGFNTTSSNSEQRARINHYAYSFFVITWLFFYDNGLNTKVFDLA